MLSHPSNELLWSSSMSTLGHRCLALMIIFLQAHQTIPDVNIKKCFNWLVSEKIALQISMYSILLLTVLHNHGIMEKRRNLHVRFDIADIKYTVLILFVPEPIHLFFSFESFVADTGCFTMQEPCKRDIGPRLHLPGHVCLSGLGELWWQIQGTQTCRQQRFC